MTPTDTIDGLDWATLGDALDREGYAELPSIVGTDMCRRIASLYDDPETSFRSTITMARHNFGRGEYKYLDYPLPDMIAELRSAFYPHLARIANEWARRLGEETHWPDRLDHLLDACHQTGQTRPTPLLLRYGAGDYNCLHQDLYGKIHFPLQVIVQLTDRNSDFNGGELVLVEQRPRMQSRPIVIDLPQGACVIIPVRDRPAMGARGWRRHQMRHGVSMVKSGVRHTLGLIFHDAV